jgi:hypothetical protein
MLQRHRLNIVIMTSDIYKCIYIYEYRTVFFIRFHRPPGVKVKLGANLMYDPWIHNYSTCVEVAVVVVLLLLLLLLLEVINYYLVYSTVFCLLWLWMQKIIRRFYKRSAIHRHSHKRGQQKVFGFSLNADIRIANCQNVDKKNVENVNSSEASFLNKFSRLRKNWRLRVKLTSTRYTA